MSQYGVYALHAGKARLHAHAHAPGTHTHAHTDQYVILIACLQQQWLRERATMLRYTYIACLVYLRTAINFPYSIN